MKSKFEEREKAQMLRRQGMSFREIRKIIPVSKSSLSLWLRFLPLSAEEAMHLEDRARRNVDNGSERAALSNRKNRVVREEMAFMEAKSKYEAYSHDPIFILGVGLYWAEGSKRTTSFQFMNSDHTMISFMIFWVKKYLGFTERDIFLRLTTHEDFKLEKYEDYWSQKTGIPLSNFKKTTYKVSRHGVFKKNPNYKGCVRLEVGGGIKTLRIMMSLQKILNNELKLV